LRDRLDDIRAAGAELVLVGNGSVQFAARFQAEKAPDCAVFTDPSLEAYRELGMKRGVWATLSPAALLASVRATRRGYRQTSTEGDGWQQGGTYAVAKGGRIVYAKANRNAGDRPDLDAALAALRVASQMGRP
jgi:peroxiredoxin